MLRIHWTDITAKCILHPRAEMGIRTVLSLFRPNLALLVGRGGLKRSDWAGLAGILPRVGGWHTAVSGSGKSDIF